MFTGSALHENYLKPIYFTLIEQQVFTFYTKHSRFCFPGTTPVFQYLRQMCGPMKIRGFTTVPGNRTPDLTIAWPTLYLTITHTTSLKCCCLGFEKRATLEFFFTLHQIYITFHSFFFFPYLVLGCVFEL